MKNIHELPPNLPQPIDDGATHHLIDIEIPHIALTSTLGRPIQLRDAFQKPTILFIYPRAGSPLEPNIDQASWDKIPGARGCTPQSCGFRDLHSEFKTLGVSVFGLSMQSPTVQKEFVERNEISFPILSDWNYKLTESLNLPTFIFKGERLIKRMVLYINNNQIKKVFYPVFPPDKNAQEVLDWLQSPTNPFS